MTRELFGGLVAVVILLAPVQPVPVEGTTPGGDSGITVQKVRENRHPRPEGWMAAGQAAALEWASIELPRYQYVLQENLPLRQQRLNKLNLGVKDIKQSYLLLNSPFINTIEDKYGPVRFLHAKHAASLSGDCAACHHYRPVDMAASETVACRSCHQESFASQDEERVGLKAAYHLKCQGCHVEMKQGPVSCDGCHSKNHSDHEFLVQLPDFPDPTEVTDECLRCHEAAGQDMLASVHWLWRRPSPYTDGNRKCIMSGKGTTALNNF